MERLVTISMVAYCGSMRRHYPTVAASRKAVSVAFNPKATICPREQQIIVAAIGDPQISPRKMLDEPISSSLFSRSCQQTMIGDLTTDLIRVP